MFEAYMNTEYKANEKSSQFDYCYELGTHTITIDKAGEIKDNPAHSIFYEVIGHDEKGRKFHVTYNKSENKEKMLGSLNRLCDHYKAIMAFNGIETNLKNIGEIGKAFEKDVKGRKAKILLTPKEGYEHPNANFIR